MSAVAMTATSSAKRPTTPAATASPAAAAANTTGASTCRSACLIVPEWTATATSSGRRSPKNAGTDRVSAVAGPRPSRALTAAASAITPMS
jgi:hypothetical protein